VAYVNPNSARDTCEQYNSKVVFGLRQAWGQDNVTLLNASASNVVGPVGITVAVINNATNRTGGCAGLLVRAEGEEAAHPR
jgi:hypothetical protein